MALFSIPQLKAIARADIPVQLSANARVAYMKKSLQEARRFSENDTFDIFLSHKFSDLEVVYGLEKVFKRYGYSVYVDSEVDRHLNRAAATKDNARALRNRLRHCKCLVVATTENFQESVWIPWEVGYFDGRGGPVAVAPVTLTTRPDNNFKGCEYFGLYPYVAEEKYQGKTTKTLWVMEHKDRFVEFANWLKGKPFRNRPKPAPVKKPTPPVLKSRLPTKTTR